MFVRTERLLLRPGWPEDAPALAHAIANEAIVRNLARVPWPYDLSDARCFLHTERGRSENALLVFRRTRAAPKLIGGVGIHSRTDGEMELGYWISRPHWGLGYATEAAAALIRTAHHSLRLKRIQSEHFVDNPASGRVLTKLGFRPTGRIASRFSLGRGARVPAKLFTLHLDCDAVDVDPLAPQNLMQSRIAA